MSSPTGISNGIGLKFQRADALAISSLFAIGALVYGVFISSVGFYWDDWPVIWVYRALGSQGVTDYFAGNRPISGWIYAHLAPLLGISPIGWQTVNLVVRCVSSVGLYVFFCLLWRKRKDFAWLVAALVLVYPGFTQQAIALTYFSQHLSFLCFVVSLLATTAGIKKPAYQWLFVPFSITTGVICYLITEYFVGLEFFRLIVIVALKDREGVKRDFKNLKNALLAWSPYAATWTGYLIWRSFIFHEIHYGPVGDKDIRYILSRVLSSPVREVVARASNGIHNIVMAAVCAWARPFSPDFITLNSGSGILSLMIAALVVGIGFFTLRRLTIDAQPLQEPQHSREMPARFLKTGVMMGIVGLCVAGLPLVSGQTTFFVPHPSFGDRFTLPFMLPASLTLSCLLVFLGTRGLTRTLLILLVLFGSSVYQVQSMNFYRHDWLTQKSVFWQLAWRAPGLKVGTSVFVDGLPETIGSNENAGLLNMLYNRDDSAGRLDYFIVDLLRFPLGKLSYRPGDPVVARLRSFEFQGMAAQSFVSWLSPHGTLRVVEVPYADQILRGSLLCLNISHLSHPGEVISDTSRLPGGPLLSVFGSEPRHEWQYFYQKADLERQLKHWDAVALLGDEVMKGGYKPTDPSEWFPFIDGYAMSHRYQTAAAITTSVLRDSPDALVPLSALWRRVRREGSPDDRELSNALSDLRDRLMLPDGN